MKDNIVIIIIVMTLLSIGFIIGYKSHVPNNEWIFDACDEYCFHGYDNGKMFAIPVGYIYNFTHTDNKYLCLCDDGSVGWFN